MKNQLLLTLPGLMIALSTLFLACTKEDNGPKSDNPYRLEANLLMDNTLFRNTLSDRNSKNTFEILEVTRKNDVLEVMVKGGGDGESFQFIWDGRVQESFPMGIRLIMLYNGEDESFDREKEITAVVNLQKIIGERNNVNDYHFNVVNGSKIQTVTLNPDGTTATESK
ncbi:hypothetical protein [Parapedobacter pyrenivorans]|nr:hypothetical protein [Parapedobacter pyrenivorans]